MPSRSIVLSAEDVQFEVDSALLADASPVFATLLRLPADPTERSVRLAGDTARDVHRFLEALRSPEVLPRAALPHLLSVAAVAHKYECDTLAASAFRRACDAIRTASPPPDAPIVHNALSTAARFDAETLAELSDALIQRAVDPLVVLAACDSARICAPRLEGWALYALVTNPEWRALPLTPELRRRLLLGENALRDVQPLRWETEHPACAREWANAWPDEAVRGKVDVFRALRFAESSTLKRLSVPRQSGGRPCKACVDMSTGEVRNRAHLLERNLWTFFTDEGPFNAE